MLAYRIYVFEEGDHIKQVPRILECRDDAEAIQQARQLLDGKPMEVWEGARIVVRLSPDK